MKIIKGIQTNKYEVYIIETDEGMYYVDYRNGNTEGQSDPLFDYNIASHLFYLKVRDMEGV